jgi:23S rRNA pseudouridine1911/1915/1917 synthase
MAPRPEARSTPISAPSVHTAESFPVTDAYRGMRLDRFLQRMLPRMSRASIQQAIASRVSLASGSPAKCARRLVVGDTVTVAPRTESTLAAAPAIAIARLAAGDGWLVVDKPAGMTATPSSRRPGHDVATMLAAAPAHRLDRFTSGCLLLTTDPVAARRLDAAFRAHAIAKEYLAVVHGSPRADRFEIDAPLGPHPSSRITGKVGVVASGLAAATTIEVLARTSDRALVRARPRTGRRHQIRAHLAAVGHAIVGDLIYGADERQFIRMQRGQAVDTAAGLCVGRHLLHAHRLAFAAPCTGQPIVATAPLPSDFAGWPAVGPAAVDHAVDEGCGGRGANP